MYASSPGGLWTTEGNCVVVPAVTVAGVSAANAPLAMEYWCTLVAL